jgi:hypothetical protein
MKPLCVNCRCAKRVDEYGQLANEKILPGTSKNLAGLQLLILQEKSVKEVFFKLLYK